MSVMNGGSLTWLGHAAFRIDTEGGKTILVDPFLKNNPACPPALQSPARCDLILVTHAHGDHLGDTIPLAVRTGAHVVAIVELVQWLATKGVTNATGMNKGGTYSFGEIAVTMVHALHSSSIADGRHALYGGEAAGFVVRLENGFRVYHAGDTCVFSDMALIGELYQPDLALLPIGDHYTMSPREAAKAVRLLGVQHVVPMHMGTFPVLTGTAGQLRELLADSPEVTVHDLQPGESLR
jgi:L-ascorbate metabolism protein UlaG (beta-lactamase superfamily)